MSVVNRTLAKAGGKEILAGKANNSVKGGICPLGSGWHRGVLLAHYSQERQKK